MDPTVDALRDMLDVPANAWMAGCALVGALAIVAAFVVKARIARREHGSEAMQRASRAIHVGVRAHMRAHLPALAGITLVPAVVLVLAFAHVGDGWTVGLSFVAGCAGSAIAGSLAQRAAEAG